MQLSFLGDKFQGWMKHLPVDLSTVLEAKGVAGGSLSQFSHRTLYSL